MAVTFLPLSRLFYKLFLYHVIGTFLFFRFQPDKGFAGTDRGQRRDGPVQFEKEEEDPFGLDKFLTEAKKGKRPLDEPSRSRYYIPHTLMIIDRLICVNRTRKIVVLARHLFGRHL